jgi:hypothetical protein
VLHTLGQLYGPAEIVEDLRAALEQFEQVAGDLRAPRELSGE